MAKKKSKGLSLNLLKSRKFAFVAALIVAALAIFGLYSFAGAGNNGTVGRTFDWRKNQVTNDYRTVSSRRGSWQFVKYTNSKLGKAQWSYLGAWIPKPEPEYASRELDDSIEVDESDEEKNKNSNGDVKVFNSALAVLGEKESCVGSVCKKVSEWIPSHKSFTDNFKDDTSKSKFLAIPSAVESGYSKYLNLKLDYSKNGHITTDVQKLVLIAATQPAFSEKDNKGIFYDWKNSNVLYNGGGMTKKAGSSWEFSSLKGKVPAGIWMKKGTVKFGSDSLKPGATGTDVAMLQSMINWVNLAYGQKFSGDKPLTVNGLFDGKTEEAVKNFHKFVGLKYGTGASTSTYNALVRAMSLGIQIPSNKLAKLPKYKAAKWKCGYIFDSKTKKFTAKTCPKPKSSSSGGGSGGGSGSSSSGSANSCKAGQDCNGDGVISSRSDSSERPTGADPDYHSRQSSGSSGDSDGSGGGGGFNQGGVASEGGAGADGW